MLTAVFTVILAGLEWWRYFYSTPPSPIMYSVIAGIVMLYAGWTIWSVGPALRQLRLARDGEKVVGQYLERFRQDGYQVFHDVIGQGFNLDHVLIGPAGIFTIETKTFSKPARGQPKIVFDGEKIVVAGHEPDRNPVIQAKSQGKWLMELLSESTGRKFPVRPVVLFPGWFIEQSSGSSREVWVLAPKAMPSFLANEPTRLPPEDVRLAAFHLSRFIRDREGKG